MYYTTLSYTLYTIHYVLYYTTLYTGGAHFQEANDVLHHEVTDECVSEYVIDHVQVEQVCLSYVVYGILQ
jgi:hypothetical protein